MFTEGRKEEMNVESFEYLVYLNLFEVVVVMHIRYGIMKLLIRPIPSIPSPQTITNEGTLGAIRTYAINKQTNQSISMLAPP